MALNLQKRGIGLANIRESDTATAAAAVVPAELSLPRRGPFDPTDPSLPGAPADIYGRTKEQFDQGALGRALDRPLRPGEPGPRDPWQPASDTRGIISRDAAPVRTLPTGAGVQQTKDKPGTTPKKEDDDSDPFGTLVDILTRVVSFGVPVRQLLAEGRERKRQTQAIQAYGVIIDGTKDLIGTFGGMPAGPARDRAVDVRIEALNLIQPGAGDSVRGAWEAHTSGALNLNSMEKPWIVEQIAANCGTGPGAQDCANKFTSDEGWVQRQDDKHDAALLPDIMDWFDKIGQAATSTEGGEEAVKKVMENGITADELLRLPPEFQFPEEHLEAIFRSEKIQEELIPFGFRPSGLVRKEAEAEITGAGLTNLAKLQRERAEAEAAGDTRLAAERNKKIQKEITIIGRTAEDVRTGLRGATPKDLDKLRSGIRDLQGNLSDLEKTRKAFEISPQAGGILGSVIESVGGVLAQIPFIGGDLADMLPGDREKVKKARTRARFLAGSMLSTITNEDTGRFTDTERKIADNALAALDITADPLSIRVALETAIEIMTDSQNRKVDELFSVSGLDLTDDADKQKFHAILLDNGFTSVQAFDAVLDLMNRRGIPLE